MARQQLHSASVAEGFTIPLGGRRARGLVAAVIVAWVEQLPWVPSQSVMGRKGEETGSATATAVQEAERGGGTGGEPGGGGGRQGHWLQRLNKVRRRGLSFSLQASTRPRTGTPVKESSHGCGRSAPEFIVVCELYLWEHCKSASSPIFSCIKLESNDAYSSIPPPRSRSRGIVLSRGECRKKPANGRRSRAGAAFSCFRKHD